MTTRTGSLTTWSSKEKSVPNSVFCVLDNCIDKAVERMEAMQDDLRRMFTRHFGKEGVEQIAEFLDRDFSVAGVSAVADLLLYAKIQGKSLDEILVAFEVEWEKKWSTQPVAVRGDPNAHCMGNKLSFGRICKALDIASLFG